MLKQFLEIKEQHPDKLLLFRMGDFYETFYNDAKICAKVLDIALTTRDKNSTNSTKKITTINLARSNRGEINKRVERTKH